MGRRHHSHYQKKPVIRKAAKFIITVCFMSVAVYFTAYGLGLDRALVAGLRGCVAGVI